MTEPFKTDLELQVRIWIKKNPRESSHLEFKLKVEISTPGGRAEFIRNALSLANSEGKTPQKDGYLVVGFKDGRFHDKNEPYDGATFGEILPWTLRDRFVAANRIGSHASTVVDFGALSSVSCVLNRRAEAAT